jgi:diguanylate cyclase (GGDEF)-like protein
MSDRFEVPEVFRGEVPDSFYADAVRHHDLPHRSRAVRLLGGLLFNRLAEESRMTDLVVRSLYRQALAEKAESEAISKSEADRYDEVTNLLTRKYFKRDGDSLLESVGGERRSAVIGFLIDVVDFGDDINNVHGHTTGDVALAGVAGFLESSIRSDIGDLVGRWGGDEFGMLIHINDPTANPHHLARKIGGRLINIPFTEIAQPKQIRFRAALHEPGMNTEELMSMADMKGPNKYLAVYSRINPAYFSR